MWVGERSHLSRSPTDPGYLATSPAGMAPSINEPESQAGDVVGPLAWYQTYRFVVPWSYGNDQIGTTRR
jgi:hypothetical protein